MAQWKIKGPLPFEYAMGKLQTRNKAMEKLRGAKWPDEENRKLGPWWCNGTLIWGALWWRNGQIRDPSDGEIWVPWWRDEEIWGPRPLTLFKWFYGGSIALFQTYGPQI